MKLNKIQASRLELWYVYYSGQTKLDPPAESLRDCLHPLFSKYAKLMSKYYKTVGKKRVTA